MQKDNFIYALVKKVAKVPAATFYGVESLSKSLWEAHHRRPRVHTLGAMQHAAQFVKTNPTVPIEYVLEKRSIPEEFADNILILAGVKENQFKWHEKILALIPYDVLKKERFDVTIQSNKLAIKMAGLSLMDFKEALSGLGLIELCLLYLEMNSFEEPVYYTAVLLTIYRRFGVDLSKVDSTSIADSLKPETVKFFEKAKRPKLAKTKIRKERISKETLGENLFDNILAIKEVVPIVKTSTVAQVVEEQLMLIDFDLYSMIGAQETCDTIDYNRYFGIETVKAYVELLHPIAKEYVKVDIKRALDRGFICEAIVLLAYLEKTHKKIKTFKLEIVKTIKELIDKILSVVKSADELRANLTPENYAFIVKVEEAQWRH